MSDFFKAVEYTPRHLELCDDGVRLPEIFVDPELRAAFDGNEFDITFNASAVVGIANRTALKDHVSVVLVVDHGLESEKPVRFPENLDDFSRDTVIVGIEVNPEDIEQAQIDANERLVTGMLASNLLDNPVKSTEELARIRKIIRNKALARKVGGGTITAAGATSKIFAMTGMFVLPAISVITTQVIGFGMSTWGRMTQKRLQELHLFSGVFEDHVVEEMAKLAKVLAQEYVVIDYTVDQPEDQ